MNLFLTRRSTFMNMHFHEHLIVQFSIKMLVLKKHTAESNKGCTCIVYDLTNLLDVDEQFLQLLECQRASKEGW